MLRKAILERFPTDEVGRYVEVFGGAAWVLFAKEKKANQLEVYNDINSNLVNLFRCVEVPLRGTAAARWSGCLPHGSSSLIASRRDRDAA